jgi:high frequency lysogenization protein
VSEEVGSIEDRALALAGVFQALGEVQRAARTGGTESAPTGVSLESALRLDAPSVEAVYGGRAGLRQGLELLVRQLGGAQGRDVEIGRYFAGLLVLERKLVRRRDLMGRLREGLEAIAPEAERSGADDDAVIAKLAELYRATVGELGPRIMVSGEPGHLQNPRTAEWIRALLLAAMRSTVLWRQLGGTRLGLTFSRERLVAAARAILAAPLSGSDSDSGVKGDGIR